MSSFQCLIRPKPVRPIAEFHTSKSAVFTAQAKPYSSPAFFVPLLTLEKAKSEEFPASKDTKGPSLEKLVGRKIKSEVSIAELAMVEREMRCRLQHSPDLAPRGFSDQLRDSEEDSMSVGNRHSYPLGQLKQIAPPRPSNPMTRDKLWAAGETNSCSTESDSDSDLIRVNSEDVCEIEGNTDHV